MLAVVPHGLDAVEASGHLVDVGLDTSNDYKNKVSWELFPCRVSEKKLKTEYKILTGSVFPRMLQVSSANNDFNRSLNPKFSASFQRNTYFS